VGVALYTVDWAAFRQRFIRRSPRIGTPA